ncbi:hypothetical protein GQX74_006529 [Glossina fuscipes]|nr:hypothetical protein GQX74_006529 [Glossina fuscipes]
MRSVISLEILNFTACFYLIWVRGLFGSGRRATEFKHEYKCQISALLETGKDDQGLEEIIAVIFKTLTASAMLCVAFLGTLGCSGGHFIFLEYCIASITKFYLSLSTRARIEPETKPVVPRV